MTSLLDFVGQSLKTSLQKVMTHCFAKSALPGIKALFERAKKGNFFSGPDRFQT